MSETRKLSLSLSVSDIKQMNKDQLKKHLKDIIRDLNEEKSNPTPNILENEDSATIMKLLTSILDEVNNLCQEKIQFKKRIEYLENQTKTLSEAVFQHQRFLEANDSAKRSCNLIITGVPEDDDHVAEAVDENPAERAVSEKDKVSLILKKVEQKESVNIVEVTRLGKKQGGNNSRPRPLKVVTNNPQERKLVLDSTIKLKHAGQSFSKIFVKKDLHPIVCRELNRLRAVIREEKNKHENAGKSVVYDRETRCLKVDGIVVDRFKMFFFRRQYNGSIENLKFEYKWCDL